MPADAKRADIKDSSFPSLGSVPDKPAPETTQAERRELAKGLVSDRTNARYTDETLRAATDAGVAPPPPVPVRREAEPEKTADKMMGKAESKAAMLQSAPSGGISPPTPVVAAPQSVPVSAATPSVPVSSPPPVAALNSSDRLSVPEIIQRPGQPPPPPTPIQEVSRRQAAPMPTASSGVPASVAMSETAAPAVESSEDRMHGGKPAAPSMTETATASMVDAVAPVSSLPTRPVMPQAAAPMIDLPVGQDQSALTQAFSAGVAQQNAGQYQPGQGETMTISSAGVSLGDRPFAGQPSSAGSGGEAGHRLPGAPILVHFANGASQLGPKGRSEVKSAVAEAKRHAGIIRVVGHASQRTGDMNYARHKTVNFAISLDRANAVASELSRLGIDRDRIVVEAKGDSDPMFYEFMPNGEAYNRRVEIYLE